MENMERFIAHVFRVLNSMENLRFHGEDYFPVLVFYTGDYFIKGIENTHPPAVCPPLCEL